eukprot:2373179-Rhodomonas_salina.2
MKWVSVHQSLEHAQDQDQPVADNQLLKTGAALHTNKKGGWNLMQNLSMSSSVERKAEMRSACARRAPSAVPKQDHCKCTSQSGRRCGENKQLAKLDSKRRSWS